MVVGAVRIDRWEFDSRARIVRHGRGFGTVVRAREYPLGTMVAVRVDRMSGRWDEAVDDASVSGDRYATARGFRRGFARLSIEFADGTRGTIQTDSLRAYQRLLAAAEAIERHTGVAIIDE